MIASLLLCWYSFGWFTAGVTYLYVGRMDCLGLLYCLALSPLAFFIVSMFAGLQCFPDFGPSKQYLWRRKP